MAKTKTGPDAAKPAPTTPQWNQIGPGIFKLRPAASLPPREWLYGRDFIRKFVTVTVAAGGAGKTLLATVEALAMVTGRPLLGTAPARPLTVWTINGEDPLDEMERRFAAAAQHYGLTTEDIGGRLFVNSGQDRRLIITDSAKKGIHILSPVMVNLHRHIKAMKIDVLVVDPFVSCHHLNENDNAAIDAVAKTWGRLANLTGCAVHLVHHTRKTSGAEATVEDGRGASALMAAARVGRVLNPMTKDEADRAGLASAHGYFRMSYGKTSLCRLPEDATWLRLVGTDLGNGPAGSPGDDVGVVTTWTWPDTPASVEPDHIHLIHQALSDGDWRESPQAQRWAGKAIADALGLALPEDTPKVKVLIKTLLTSGHLATLEGHDSKRMARTFLVPATPGEHEVWQGVASEAE